jgi:hypothetical protein
MNARLTAGLTDKIVDIKSPSKDPGVGYNAFPEVNSFTTLLESRKKEQVEEFGKMEVRQGQYKIGMDRLNEREDCLIRQGY